MAVNQENLKGLLWKSFLRVVSSLFFGVVFFVIWLATFLLISSIHPIIEGVLRLISPVITGIGFAVGATILNRLVNVDDGPFLRILIWPLVGCIVGALIVYWFGPMLIVFSMLVLGTFSVLMRELLRIIFMVKNGSNL